MHIITSYVQNNIILAWITLAISFVVLAKFADLFVDSSIALANKFKIPKLVTGIVLVSLATTAPELSVSLISAIQGKPEMALGNAIGSVICDDGLALALAGILAVSPILILPNVLKTSGIFLIFIEILCFSFVAFDNTLNRWEGAVLVLMFILYICFLFIMHKKGLYKDTDIEEDKDKEKENNEDKGIIKILALFAAALAGIIIASEFIITSATCIAYSFHIPESIIALLLVALGTSIPEVATCIIAVRKKEGAIAVGNILGADIMNICWVAGASAIVNDLALGKKEIFFMFPAMFIIVAIMLICLRTGYRLTRIKGFILFAAYIIYIASSIILFPPG